MRALRNLMSRAARASRLRRSLARRLAFCTVVTREYLPWALVLFDSLRVHHPGAHLSLLYVAANGEKRVVPVVEGVSVIDAGRLLDSRDEATRRRRYAPGELVFSLKPRLLRHALDHWGDRVIYLDADVDVLAPLDEALAELEGASALLTPHLDAPIPMDGRRPSDLTILRSGAFNAGFIGIAEGDEARRLLDWWDCRVARWGFVAPEFGYLGDQRWLDLAPSLFRGIRVLHDTGSNVGAWNLHSRPIALENGIPTVHGARLAFVHFSGFDPDRPTVLSKYQDRFEAHAQPEVMKIASRFAARIVAARSRATTLEWTPIPANPEPPDAPSFRQGPMPAHAYRAKLEVTAPEGSLETGEEAVYLVRITNRSTEPWQTGRSPDGRGGIAVSYHLRGPDGQVLQWENPRFFLPRDVEAGESIEVEAAVPAPRTPGRYLVEFGLVHEGVAWFSQYGEAGASVDLPTGVFGPRS